jgi:hypothetical protein
MNNYAKAIAIVGVTGYAGRDWRAFAAGTGIRVTGAFDSVSFSHEALRTQAGYRRARDRT